MEMRNYSDYSLTELTDLYTRLIHEGNQAEADKVWEYIQEKEAEETDEESNLAGRGTRLLASIIDSVTFLILVVVVFLLISLSTNEGNITDSAKGLAFIFLLLAALLIYCFINAVLLKRYGQTIGKRMLAIKIVTLDGQLPPLRITFGLRILIPAFISAVPILGYLFSFADVLFIFGNERRCLHDHIAGTKVINA